MDFIILQEFYGRIEGFLASILIISGLILKLLEVFPI